ncbi:MAG TPA: cobyric acid synthase [Patescibacteria group bacterium]|nr:cobyric acid synthase [Patescibacteria group bacterium]
MRPAPCVMVQGTASGVGKSLLVAALCRIFARAGYRVAPFKSQNMSLNAAVSADGGEIGRAQAVQAAAAGIEPTVDMNPILLKPERDDRSQVVVRGRALASLDWRGYGRLAPTLWPVVVESLERLRRAHDLVVIEGAGSPAEINLDFDLANMRVAALAEAPVLLVGDIDRGGVFGALVGTLALLAPDDRARVAGLVVNRLRGDPSVLAPGLALLAARTGVPVLGVVPHLGEAPLPEEDSLGLESGARHVADGRLTLAVPRLPRIANFDDLEPLAAEPGVAVRFVTGPAAIDGADVVVLPGSKTTVADLAWLRERGLDAAIARAAADGRAVIGICAGYQMLGERLADPDHVESDATSVSGLGLLPVVTTFARDKTTARVHGRVLAGGPFGAAAGAPVQGYEIHCGRTAVHGGAPVFALTERAGVATEAVDGTRVGSVIGTYLHGCFSSGALRRALLTAAAARRGVAPEPRWGAEALADRYDRLADGVAAALDLEALGRLARCPLGAVTT